ncbi:Protein of unknown function [Pyronema omphalodes CBS 100304]|uniref:Uncharacterized protein n=1 Tax=Pyronema omphalodes (strain CBS 100304) TaxID=1076935 RepID=U4LTX9_PYROM|nr:Protein of unknown function [Pyronema omphalodes CBS 100304]
MSFEVDGYLVVRSAIEMEMIQNVETDISREINVMEGMRSEQSFDEGAAFKLGWPQSCADIVSTFVKKTLPNLALKNRFLHLKSSELCLLFDRQKTVAVSPYGHTDIFVVIPIRNPASELYPKLYESDENQCKEVRLELGDIMIRDGRMGLLYPAMERQLLTLFVCLHYSVNV